MNISRKFSNLVIKPSFQQIYVDDCVILLNDKKKIEETMKSLVNIYAITDESTMEQYIGIKLEHPEDTI